MIIKEFYKTRTDGVNLYRTYSDNRVMIRKIGTDEIYEEAIDIESGGFTYEETEELVDILEDEFSDAEFRALIEEAL